MPPFSQVSIKTLAKVGNDQAAIDHSRQNEMPVSILITIKGTSERHVPWKTPKKIAKSKPLDPLIRLKAPSVPHPKPTCPPSSKTSKETP